MTQPVRILLGTTASAALSEAGGESFIVIHRAMRCEEPEINRRWVIHLIPTSLKLAQSAVDVAMGKATARRLKASPRPPQAQPQASQPDGEATALPNPASGIKNPLPARHLETTE